VTHNHTLQWTGLASSVLVNLESVGAVPAIERRSVIRQEALRLSWEGTLALQRPLFVARVGLRQDEVRVFLYREGEDAPRHVLRLSRVFKLFDRLPRGQAVEITDTFPHGSFGWDVPGGIPHHSVKISAGEDRSLMVLAREVEYYMADRSEALNWPG
jgi:hypothetical protein